MEEKYLAEYLRLSMEDGDVVTSDVKEESNSILHQRELIVQYRDERQLYPELQALEFVDDGYSGTNFERPAVQQMLAMIREGKICCVIVKDISRFGRNYLEVCDFLEQIFPFLGVRFIAVNDGYDSDDYVGTTGGIEIAFKSLLYDLYSKDLSAKMRSTLEIRRRRGDFIGPRPPFGYQFSSNRKVLKVDKVAARYVKYVFALACDGYSSGQIARILNEEKIPTPGQYKNQGRMQYHIIDGDGYWSHNTVLKILKNKVYLGTVVNGKNRVTKVGGKHFTAVPEKEQICVAGRHEAIVSEDVFRKAADMIKYRGSQNAKKHSKKQESILLGKVRCGNCHRCLIRIDCTTVPYFTCKRARYEKNSKCVGEHLEEPELEKLIIESIKQKLEMQCLEERQQYSSDASADLENAQIKKEKTGLEKKRNSLKFEKQNLYEQFKMGRMERGTYLDKVAEIRTEETELDKQIKKLEEESDRKEEKRHDGEAYKPVSGLTKEIVESMIDTIYVHGKSEIEVVWKEIIKKV